jgi:hypothetical protein
MIYNFRALLSIYLGSLLTLTLGVNYDASAFGLFVSSEPIATSETGRILVVRTPTGIRYLLQGKVALEAESKAFWLIPVPNVANTDDNPPLIRPLDPAVLEELAELSVPRFEGACDGEPQDQASTAR